MPKEVKYVKVRKGWWSGAVNEKDLAMVINKYQKEGWVFEGVEDHGSFLNRKWMARFSRGIE